MCVHCHLDTYFFKLQAEVGSNKGELRLKRNHGTQNLVPSISHNGIGQHDSQGLCLMILNFLRN